VALKKITKGKEEERKKKKVLEKDNNYERIIRESSQASSK